MCSPGWGPKRLGILKQLYVADVLELEGVLKKSLLQMDDGFVSVYHFVREIKQSALGSAI